MKRSEEDSDSVEETERAPGGRETAEERRKDVMLVSSSEEKKRAAGYKMDGGRAQENSAPLKFLLPFKVLSTQL